MDVEDFDDASCLLGKLSKSLYVVECHLIKARHRLASEDLPSKTLGCTSHIAVLPHVQQRQKEDRR